MNFSESGNHKVMHKMTMTSSQKLFNDHAIVILSVNTVVGVEFKFEHTAHKRIPGGCCISPPRMGGAWEQASELQQFPVILLQGQLDDILN